VIEAPCRTAISFAMARHAVGNGNNGKADTFGASNGTNPDVPETTGVEVVNPLNEFWPSPWIPVGNSAEVDPLLQFRFTTKPDKPGKDDNYRGITEYGRALYFTKGSGSNGVDTVYSVDSLPTLATAASTQINIVPGFPTDSEKATRRRLHPFSRVFRECVREGLSRRRLRGLGLGVVTEAFLGLTTLEH